MNEVARSLGVAMSTATQLADRLERLGLVERRADPADRRVVRLALTEAGRSAIAEHARERDARIAVAMQRLTPVEREAVLNGLRLLETAARQNETAPGQTSRHPIWEIVTAAMPPASSQQSE
jgi:DNA-binding MarR family transcriptional regulator